MPTLAQYRGTFTQLSTPKKILIAATTGSAAIVILILALVFHGSPSQVVRADPALVQRLQARIDEARRSATNDHPQVVSMSEFEINSLIRSQLALFHKTQQRTVLRDVEVRLVKDQIGVHIALNAYGEDVTMDIAGVLWSEDGFIRFDPVAGSIGALPIPASALKAAVRKAMASSESQNKMRLPKNVSDLRVKDGNLIARYD